MIAEEDTELIHHNTPDDKTNYHRVRNQDQQESRRSEVMRLYLRGITERGISSMMNIDRRTVAKDLEAVQEELAKRYSNRYVEAEIETELQQLKDQKETLLIMASQAENERDKRSINKEIREISMFLAKFYQTIEGRQYALMGNGEREYQPN